MKKLIFVLVIIFIASFDVVASDRPQVKVGEVDPNGEVVTIKAYGLVCDFCANAIEKVFMRQDEVSGIDVSLAKHHILIAFKQGQQLDDAEITKLVTDSGYNVKEISRKLVGADQ